MTEADDNWLEAEVISCPGCGVQLYAVLHSPFCDDYRLYCDHCPHAVEISFYDPVCMAVVDRLPDDRSWEMTMAAIEPLLRPCECGGRFRGGAPRRCFACVSEVPAAARKDLLPHYEGVDLAREPTAEQQAEFDRFEAEFIGREHLWASSPSDHDES